MAEMMQTMPAMRVLMTETRRESARTSPPVFARSLQGQELEWDSDGAAEMTLTSDYTSADAKCRVPEAL
eukprot:5494506-Amphidinium_carterae.1